MRGPELLRGTAVIYRRELSGLFLQPVAWVLLALGLFLNGYAFPALLIATKGDADAAFLYAFRSGFGWISIVLPPLLTMRMISEEARSGMLEYLLTAPVKDGALVLGKVLAATTFMAVLWGGAFVLAAALAACGAAIDWPRLVLAWGGTVLASLVFCSAGLVASALAATPVVAAFLGMMLCAGIVLLPTFVDRLAFASRATRRALIERIDLAGQLEQTFLRGMFDSSTLVLLVSTSAVLLVLCTRRLEMQRWRS
ncbi:MAG: hypothetical protein EPO68_01705 [Planctomycetota bacterium]|nr:MAG: hypothetical protein EPO68_01705 [Planctomycetota bacterium]